MTKKHQYEKFRLQLVLKTWLSILILVSLALCPQPVDAAKFSGILQAYKSSSYKKVLVQAKKLLATKQLTRKQKAQIYYLVGASFYIANEKAKAKKLFVKSLKLYRKIKVPKENRAHKKAYRFYRKVYKGLLAKAKRSKEKSNLEEEQMQTEEPSLYSAVRRYEAALQFSYETIEQKEQIIRPAGTVSLRFIRNEESILPDEINVNFRIAQNFVQDEEENRFVFDPRDIYVKWSGEKLQYSLGLQLVSWGETFGLSISDVVNPLSLERSFFADIKKLKQASPLINVQGFFDKINLQILINPYPMPPNLPGQQGQPEIGIAFEEQYSSEPEGGARLGYLFDNGFDTKLFYYRHHNRLPIFTLNLNEGRLEWISDLVDTLGGSFSYAKGAIVYRGDFIYSLGQPNFLTLEQIAAGTSTIGDYRMAAIIGADYTTEKGYLYGVQLHMDQSAGGEAENLYERSDQWLSLQTIINTFENKLETSMLAYLGINNSDIWFRPKAKYLISSRYSLAISYDYVEGNPASNFGVLNNEDRINFIIQANF